MPGGSKKKKKKLSAALARGYATTSTVPRAESASATKDSADVGKSKGKEGEGDRGAAASVSEDLFDAVESSISHAQANENEEEDEVGKAISLIEVDKELEPVFAGRGTKRKKLPPLKGNEAVLDSVNDELEEELLEFLRANWKVRRARFYSRKKCLACVLELEDLGFTLEEIESALKVTGSRVEGALEWLTLHLESEKLPRGWTYNRTRQSVRGGLEVVALEKKEKEKQESLKPNREVVKSRVLKKKQVHKNDDALQKDLILQMYERQLEEETHAEKEEEKRKIEAKLPPEERVPRLRVREAALREEASKTNDPAEKRRIGLEIKRLNEELANFQGQYLLPETEDTISAEDVQEKEQQFEDEDEGEGMSSLFEIDQDEAATHCSLLKNLKKVSLSIQPPGAEPKILLGQHVRKQYSNQTRVKYEEERKAPYVVRSVKFADKVFKMHDDEYCEDKRTAENYVAMLALYKEAFGLSYHLQMPKGCQDLWNAWKKRDENMKLLKTLEERKQRIGIVDRVEQEFASFGKSSLPVMGSESSEPELAKISSARGRRPKVTVDFRARMASVTYQEFLHTFRSELPIFTIKDELLELARENDVVIVSGQTGSGKTTQTPHLLLAEEMLGGRGDECNIACCEPRRISAVSVAERVSEEIGDPGFASGESLVGYQIRGERKMGPACRICYCTTGIILAQLQSDRLLMEYSHVVVDEVHERTVDSDFLLVALRRIIKERRQIGVPLKVILMSATIDLEKLSSYFNNAPVVEAGGRTYPVSIFPLEDCVELTGYVCELGGEYSIRGLEDMEPADCQAETELDPEQYSTETAMSVYRMDQSKANLDLIEMLLTLLLVDESRPWNEIGRFERAMDQLKHGKGTVLVFLPGMYQIQALHSRLSHHRIFGNESRFRILRLHSSLSSLKQEQKMVFGSPPPGLTKIVLSTNIAETGVTIPDVVFVIDSGRVKQTGFNPNRQMASLEEVFVPRASLTQRAGRAGRVKPGICFQLLSSQVQRDWLRDFQPPEIRRVSLESVCLQIMAMQEDSDPKSFLADALDPPTVKAVDVALDSLAEAGAVEFEAEEADILPKLTALGWHLSRFPLDIKIGKMVILSAIFGCVDPITTVAASVDQSQKLFLSPAGRQAEADQAHKQLQHECSDLLSAHVVYKSWQESGRSSAFCKKKFISYKSLQEIHRTKLELVDLIKKTLGTLSNVHADNTAVVCAVLCGGLYPNVAKVFRDQVICRNPRNDQEEPVTLTKSSVNKGEISGEDRVQWITYLTKMKTSGTRVLLYDSTAVPLAALPMFGGRLQINYEKRSLIVDRWCQLMVSPRTAVVLMCLRRILDSQLEQKFADKDEDKTEGVVISLINRILKM